MKKLFILLFLLLAKLVIASELDIKLIEYDAESTIARIQIANIGETTYHNISVSVDNSSSVFFVGKLGPSSAGITTRAITPEKHTITVSTNENIFSEEIYFAKPEDVIEDELKKIKEEKNKTLSEQLKPKRKKPILTRTAKQAIILLIPLLIIFTTLFIKKWLFRKPKIQIPAIHAPLRQPVMVPKQFLIKKLQEREKERKRILESLTPSKKGQGSVIVKEGQKAPYAKTVKPELKSQPKQEAPQGKNMHSDVFKKLRSISKEK